MHRATRRVARSRFEGGSIYWSPASGAHEVHGPIAARYEQTGGPNGKLGVPTSNVVPVAGTTVQYADFQKGVIRSSSALGVRVITELQLFLDRVVAGSIDDGRGSWLVNADHTAELVTYVTVEANGRVLANATRMPSGHAGPSYDWDKTYTISPVTAATKIHLKIKCDDWDAASGNDYLGTIDRTFDVKTCWGIDNGNNGLYFQQPATQKGGDLPSLSSLRFTFRISPPPQPVDFSVFRSTAWWSFDNFTTAALPRSLFAATFKDVEIVEGTLDEILNPFDSLFYEYVYKACASLGNCFGMSLEAAFALAGMSLFAEPIYQYYASGAKAGDVPEAEIAPLIRTTLNMKHSYQIGGDSVRYVLDKLTSLDAIRPLRVYEHVKAFLQKQDWPVLSFVDVAKFTGHSVLPYRCVDGAAAAPHRIYVADPNVVWSEAVGDPSYVEIAKDDTFKFVTNGATSYQSTRLLDVLPATLMFEIPYHVLAPQPRTPFWEALLAIKDLLKILYVGAGDAETQQITADGVQFYRVASDGTRSIAPGAVPGLARIPLLDMAGTVPELFAKRGTMPAKLEVWTLGRKQGRYQQGMRTSRHAMSLDSPAAANESDGLALIDGNTPAPVFELTTKNKGKTARVETAVGDERTGRTTLNYSVDLNVASNGKALLAPRGRGLLITPTGPSRPFEVRIRSTVRGGTHASKVTLTPQGAGETMAIHPQDADAPHGPLVVEQWSSPEGGVVSSSVVQPQ